MRVVRCLDEARERPSPRASESAETSATCPHIHSGAGRPCIRLHIRERRQPAVPMPVWRSCQPPKEATNPSPGGLHLPRITLSFRLRLSLGPLFATTLSPVHDPSRKGGSAYSRAHQCHHLACDSLAFCSQIVALQRPPLATADTDQSPRPTGIHGGWQSSCSFSTGPVHR